MGISSAVRDVNIHNADSTTGSILRTSSTSWTWCIEDFALMTSLKTQLDKLTFTSTALDVNIASGVTLEVNLGNDTDDILVYGWDGAANQKIKTDAAGELQIDILSSALPAGASTSALQTTGNSSLSSLDGKLATLGQKAMVGSAPVVLASDQTAIPASQSGTWNINDISGTISLPTGASTSALQTTGNASLSTIAGDTTSLDAKFGALGQTNMAGSAPVVIASDQSSIPVHQDNSATATLSNVAASATNVTVLAANANRKGATIYNDAATAKDVFLKFGATASATSFTVKLKDKAYYEVPFGYTGIIDGIWANAGAGTARVTEMT